MSSIHHPQVKKRLSYQRDHYAKGEHDKDRRAWSVKQKKSNRAYRHFVNTKTRTSVLDSEPTANLSIAARKRVQKWGSIKLKDVVAGKLEKRERRVGAKQARHKQKQPGY